MYGFILKKSFCDAWDNLLSMVIANIVYLVCGIGCVYLYAELTSRLLNNIPDIAYMAIVAAIFLVMMILLSIVAFAWGEQAYKITDFSGIQVLDFFKAIPGVIKDAVCFAVMVTLIIFLSIYALNFYFLENRSLIGFFVGATIMWVDVFLFLSFQWFIPLRSAMHNNFTKIIKKCFLMFFDNTGYSIILCLDNFVHLIISILFVGLVPSVGGILITSQNFLRIRLYKYDYLEEHPELKTRKERRQIPWEELIYEDREMLGPRKLKSFIFPWKDDGSNSSQDL